MLDSKFKQLAKPLLKDIGKWRKDFQATQPGNLQIDYDTFEGSAYELLGSASVLIKDVTIHGKLDIAVDDLYGWLVELDQVRRAVIANDTRNELRKAIDQCAGIMQNNLNESHKHNRKGKS